MEIWVAIIGALLGLFSIALSNYFSHRNNLKFEKQKLKEEYYKKFIEALSDNVTNSDREKGVNELAFAINRINLVGSVEVIQKVIEFRKVVKNAEMSTGFTPSNNEHDYALTEVIKAMRKDLYGIKANANYPIVGIMGKTK